MPLAENFPRAGLRPEFSSLYIQYSDFKTVQMHSGCNCKRSILSELWRIIGWRGLTRSVDGMRPLGQLIGEAQMDREHKLMRGFEGQHPGAGWELMCEPYKGAS